MNEIFVSSSKAQENRDRRIEKTRFPWRKLEVGFSFAVKKSEIEFDYLKSLAYNWGRRNNRQLRVVEHDEVYEVARIK